MIRGRGLLLPKLNTFIDKFAGESIYSSMNRISKENQKRSIDGVFVLNKSFYLYDLAKCKQYFNSSGYVLI